MIIETLIGSVVIGTMGGAVIGLGVQSAIKVNEKIIRSTLNSYMTEENLIIKKRKGSNTICLSLPDNELFSEVIVNESESIIDCKLYYRRLTLPDREEIYRFQYHKESSKFSDVESQLKYSVYKTDEWKELLLNFQQFIVNGTWKNKRNDLVNHQQITENIKEAQAETDQDILYHLAEIEKKINWLINDSSLDGEVQHTIDLLKEDVQNALAVYHGFREETKDVFKNKLIEALLEVEKKLNELSNQKEEKMMIQMDKTIALIKKR